MSLCLEIIALISSLWNPIVRVVRIREKVVDFGFCILGLLGNDLYMGKTLYSTLSPIWHISSFRNTTSAPTLLKAFSKSNLRVKT